MKKLEIWLEMKLLKKAKKNLALKLSTNAFHI